MTVPDEPSEIATPLIVTVLFTSDAFAMFVSVLEDPLIVLFVSVVVLDAVITAAPLDVSVVNAPVEGVVAPIGVPSSVLVSMLTPVMPPPVIFTEVLFCVDIVPKPVIAVFGIVVDAVMVDVPLP